MTEQEFSDLLRSKREARQLSLEDMSARLKLSCSMLRAIEEGSLSKFPHVVYARSFIRSYAQAVGVAPEDIDAGIEVLFPGSTFTEVPTVPVPVNATPPLFKRHSCEKFFAVLLMLCLLAIPAGAGWFVYTHYGEQISEIVLQLFSATSAPPVSVTEAPEKTALPDPPVAAATPPEQEQAVAPAVQVEPASAAPAAKPDSETASTAVTPAPVASVPVEGRQVSIRARQDCWVQVTVDGAGARNFHVYPGETSNIPYKRKVSLVLGNAGGVSVTHNGEPVTLNARQNERRVLTFP